MPCAHRPRRGLAPGVPPCPGAHGGRICTAVEHCPAGTDDPSHAAAVSARVFPTAGHDAACLSCGNPRTGGPLHDAGRHPFPGRSEEHTSELQSLTISYAVFCLKKKKHTSELQSLTNLVCRLLLEKKKTPSPHNG